MAKLEENVQKKRTKLEQKEEDEGMKSRSKSRPALIAPAPTSKQSLVVQSTLGGE